MNLSIYKPNSKNQGCAASFQIAQKDGLEPLFYVNFILQHSWNEQKKTGSFSENRTNPSKTISLKFNEFELGEIINAIEEKVAYSTYHTNDTNKTSIRFAPYEKVRGKDENAVKYTAFGFSVTRNGSDVFKIPLEPGECIRLISFINKFYSLLDDSRKFKRESKTKVVEKTTQAKEPATTPETSDEVDF